VASQICCWLWTYARVSSGTDSSFEEGRSSQGNQSARDEISRSEESCARGWSIYFTCIYMNTASILCFRIGTLSKRTKAEKSDRSPRAGSMEVETGDLCLSINAMIWPYHRGHRWHDQEKWLVEEEGGYGIGSGWTRQETDADAQDCCQGCQIVFFHVTGGKDKKTRRPDRCSLRTNCRIPSPTGNNINFSWFQVPARDESIREENCFCLTIDPLRLGR